MTTLHLRPVGFLVVMATLLAACSSDSPLVPNEPVVGTYALIAVGGQALPLTIAQDANGRLEILSGSLELTVNGTFREVLNFRDTPTGGDPEETSDELSGTYSVEGNLVNFAAEGQAWAGTASEGSVSYIVGNITILFKM